MKRYVYYGPAFQSAQVEERTLILPPACAGLDGRTLLFITDVHACDRFPPSAQDRLIAQAAALKADLLLLGGDYAESARWQEDFFGRLKALRPPMGIFGVAGNNDWECFSGDMEALRRIMEKSGARLLAGETARVGSGSAAISIAGLNEIKYSAARANEGFGAGDEGALRIALAHYPNAAARFAAQSEPAPHLCLSGHTHGGQWRLGPLTPYSLGTENRMRGMPLPAVSGWKEINGAALLVSPGVGTSRLPLRLGVPPAIHLLRLKRG